jgi:hypothetical protein
MLGFTHTPSFAAERGNSSILGAKARVRRNIPKGTGRKAIEKRLESGESKVKIGKVLVFHGLRSGDVSSPVKLRLGV